MINANAEYESLSTYAHNTYYASAYASVGSQVQIKFLSEYAN